jgi:hypothetical protein
MMLAFTMLWAYLHLSRFLIIWSGTSPRYLLPRAPPRGWKAAFILLLAHFVVPFLPCSRDLKGTPAPWAWWRRALPAALLDLYWLIGPDLAGHQAGGQGRARRPSTAYLTAAVACGAWLFGFAALKRL